MTKKDEADRARAILRDMRPRFEAIRARQLAAFESSAPGDTAAREQAHQILMALNLLKTELGKPIGDEAMQKGRHRGND